MGSSSAIFDLPLFVLTVVVVVYVCVVGGGGRGGEGGQFLKERICSHSHTPLGVDPF